MSQFGEVNEEESVELAAKTRGKIGVLGERRAAPRACPQRTGSNRITHTSKRRFCFSSKK